MLHEVWLFREVVVLAMLQHENAVWFQKLVFKYQAWYGREIVQGIWGVGEDEVECFVAFLQEAENVSPYQDMLSRDMLPVPAKRSNDDDPSKSR